MPATLASDRDRDTLRSFARRIDPSDAGAHNNLGVLYYNKGLYEESVAAFTKALELDPKMQVAQRNLEVAYFNTGYYDRRVAELRERLRAPRRRSRRALGAGAGLRAARTERGGDRRVHGAAALPSATISGRSCSWGSRRRRTATWPTPRRWFERALELDPSSSVTHFYLGECALQPGTRRGGARGAAARDRSSIPTIPTRTTCSASSTATWVATTRRRAASQRAIQLNPTLSRAHANLVDRPVQSAEVRGARCPAARSAGRSA